MSCAFLPLGSAVKAPPDCFPPQRAQDEPDNPPSTIGSVRIRAARAIDQHGGRQRYQSDRHPLVRVHALILRLAQLLLEEGDEGVHRGVGCVVLHRRSSLRLQWAGAADEPEDSHGNAGADQDWHESAL